MTFRRLFLQFPIQDHALFDVDQASGFANGIWALTGHSGLGKTSFLRLLSGWFAEEEGHVVSWAADMDWNPFTDVDLIGNEPSLLPWNRVATNLQTRIPLSPMGEIESVVKATGLDPKVLRARPYELSLGMYKRVEFVAALLGGRKMLLLDEFFGSLDPDSRLRCFDLVREHRADKVTIISTHSPETLPSNTVGSIRLKGAVGAAITSVELGREL